jgi:1-acyl-sn-glycerol-3-phosphate acyltransferase
VTEKKRIDLPDSSQRLANWFAKYLRQYFRKHFDAIRISKSGELPPRENGPVVIYANHASWWDPILFMLLAVELLPGKKGFGPMDAEALEKYSFFKRLGVFGIEPGTHRGAVRFLQTAEAILERNDSALWLTAEGSFSDPRQRPVTLQFGLSHLVRRIPDLRVVPLAVEFPFWNERLPEVLFRFGPPVEIPPEERSNTKSINRRLERELERTMNSLAQEAQTRDPDYFQTLMLGRSGVGGIYDQWRRWKAVRAGEEPTLFHEERRQ